jgi:hypothetical protein
MIRIVLETGRSGLYKRTPDYAMNNPPTWSEPFQMSPQSLHALKNKLEEPELLGKDWKEAEIPAIGGAAEWIVVTAAGSYDGISARATRLIATRFASRDLSGHSRGGSPVGRTQAGEKAALCLNAVLVISTVCRTARRDVRPVIR